MTKHPQVIPIPGTIDPEVIDRELNKLWRQTSGARLSEGTPGDEHATLRARVANLMIYVSDESEVSELNEALGELSARHPCRALVMVGAEQSADRDIEISVSSFCQPAGEKADRKLCCEQVTLNARGRFVAELPSAAIPLLVPDLPVFLWWSDELEIGNKVFAELADRADRIVIDSARFQDPVVQLRALAGLMRSEDKPRAAISDLNWARLTSWRALIAGCFDSTEHRAALDQITVVRIEYAANESNAKAIAPQALLIAGWLAGRLDWTVAGPCKAGENSQAVKLEKGARQIAVEFRPVERRQLQPGRLASVALTIASEPPAIFEVRQSREGQYLETSVSRGNQINLARVLQVRDRSATEWLSGEMEILCRDSGYEEALAYAAEMGIVVS